MIKLKTRTNQPVNDSEGLLDHLSQNGNTTEVSGNLDVSGNITQNGQPFAGGSKIYKHTLSNVGLNNENTRIIIYSTSSDLIDDQYKLQYNTENWLRAVYTYDITLSQREVSPILDFTFETAAYKLYIVCASGTTLSKTEIKIATYTDTVTEI